MRLLAVLTFIITSYVSHAIEFNDAVFPELATSARALAMGNAYLNKANDASAAWYNPAGLGSVRGTRFHISNFHFESNKGWLNTATSGSAFDLLGNLTKGLSLDGTRELLVERPGELAHTRFHVMPNLTTRYFTIGYLYSKRSRATLGTQDGALYEYADRRDHGPYVGLNLSLWGGVFKLGASAIYLQRREAIGENDPNTSLELNDEDYAKGSAVIVTTGVRFTLPVAALPTFSATFRNSAQQSFSNVRGTGAPTEVKNSIDIGFSLTPQIGNSTRLHFEVNYKDLSELYGDVSTSRRIVAGMEVDVSRLFFFRVGYGDGFGSGGIGIKTKKVVMDLTTYAVDTTTSEFRGEEDRRFALGISTGF